MSTEKKYVGGAKEIQGNFGSFHRISFNKTDLEELFDNLNAKGYVNINMNKRREPSHYGQTHSLVIDDWQPDPNYQRGEMPQTSNQEYKQAAQQQAPAMPQIDDVNDPEDCPF